MSERIDKLHVIIAAAPPVEDNANPQGQEIGGNGNGLEDSDDAVAGGSAQNLKPAAGIAGRR